MMFCKSFVNLCYRQHKFNELTKIYKNDRNVKLFLISRSLATLGSFNFVNLLISCRKYCIKSSNELVTLPQNMMPDNFELEPVTDESDIIKHTSFENRCLRKITDALECSNEESLKLFEKHPLIFCESIDTTIEKITFLKNSAISVENIAENAEILELNYDELVSRINEMEHWGLQDGQKNDFFPFLIFEFVAFYDISALFRMEKSIVPDGNRLVYFSKLLKCPSKTMVGHAMEYDHLISKDFTRLQKVCNILLEAGISPQYIQINLWVISNKVETIKKWLNFSNENQCFSKRDKYFVKFFRKLVEKEKNEKSILKSNQTKAEFLSEKLNVDIEIVEYLIVTYPQILNKDLALIVKVIDFLYSEGYTGTQICIAPNILNKNIQFLQERITEFRSISGSNPPVTVLNHCRSKYRQCVQWFRH